MLGPSTTLNRPFPGEAVVKWLSSWFSKQEVRGSIPGLAATISETGYLLFFKSWYGWNTAKATQILHTTNQPTNQQTFLKRCTLKSKAMGTCPNLLIASLDSFSPWNLANAQFGGSHPTLTDVTTCIPVYVWYTIKYPNSDKIAFWSEVS